MRNTRAKGDVLFEFAIIADTHLGPADDISPSPWKVNGLANARARTLVTELNKKNPAFVVHLGDMVHPVPAHPDYVAASNRFHDIFGPLTAPLHVVPGNHDIGDKPAAWSPAPPVTERFIEAYQKCFGRQFYSFDCAGVHFTVVNDIVLNTGLQVEEEQWRWLEADLAAHDRTFLFTHYPPYLLDADEEEHADNLAEPGRSRLLDLVRQHRVEAVFTAHVHNFFYDCDDATEFYVSPSMSAVRHDYSELFRVGPVEEFGRNDPEKLGYFWVEVRTDGHAAHYRRAAEQDFPASTGASMPAPLHTKTLAGSPLGIELPGAWAQPVAIPITGALDEFCRKWVRNDYLLSAVWEMGVGWLRVPFEDIASAQVRDRMRMLRRSGLRFAVFMFGLPDERAVAGALSNDDCYDRLELALPEPAIPASIRRLAELKERIGGELYVSKLRTSSDNAENTGRYAHFIDCGFRLQDAEFLRGLDGIGDAIDGLVFRTAPGERASVLAPEMRAVAGSIGLATCLRVRMSGPDPAAHHGTRASTAELARDAVEAAYADSPAFDAPFDIMLDTLIDVDRGYFPRCGLLDRHCNHTEASRTLIDVHRRLTEGSAS